MCATQSLFRLTSPISGLFRSASHDGRQRRKATNVKYYLTVEKLVAETAANFAEKTEFGWVARKSKTLATHEVFSTRLNGVVLGAYAKQIERRNV